MKGTAQEWTEEVKVVADSIDQFSSGQDKELKNMQLTLDKYVSEELKKDIPTGNLMVLRKSCTLNLFIYLFHSGVTPQRRDFSYPSHLTKTREHSQLLEEFRASNIKSLPELPDSDSEWDTTGYSTSNSEVYIVLYHHGRNILIFKKLYSSIPHLYSIVEPLVIMNAMGSALVCISEMPVHVKQYILNRSSLLFKYY